MTDKKTTIMHGVLMYPIKIGECALIYHRGQFIRTSTVVAIHYDAPGRDAVRDFEHPLYAALGTSSADGGKPDDAACGGRIMELPTQF